MVCSLHFMYRNLCVIEYLLWDWMDNNAISIFNFIIFEQSLSLDIICVLQSNNIFLCRRFRKSSPIGIMPLISMFPVINADALFLPGVLVYKFYLLRILKYFCLHWWLMNYTSWKFCNISACTDDLWIPSLENFDIFQPVMMVYEYPLLRKFTILLPVLMVYGFNLLII